MSDEWCLVYVDMDFNGWHEYLYPPPDGEMQNKRMTLGVHPTPEHQGWTGENKAVFFPEEDEETDVSDCCYMNAKLALEKYSSRNVNRIGLFAGISIA